MIGVLREGPLHRDLKALLSAPGDAFEVKVDGYVIDLVRADGELVEIQTGGFSPLRKKLDALLDRHRVRIVHPIPAERRIIRVDEDGLVLSTKRSPKKPGAATIFEGLVSFPTLLSHPNLTVEVLLCREDHVRKPAPVRGRRYLRDPGERRLIEVLEPDRARRPGGRRAADPGLRRARSPRASWPRRCASRSRSPRRPRTACARSGARARRHARPRAAAPADDCDWRRSMQLLLPEGADLDGARALLKAHLDVRARSACARARPRSTTRSTGACTVTG